MKYKIQGNIKFIYLAARGQYLLAKLEKKKNYINIKLSRKLSAYCIELPAFLAKLQAFYENLPVVYEFFKIRFYEV